MDQYGWWHLEQDMPIYSKLYFAVIPAQKADQIMRGIQRVSKDFDPEHPPRAFQVDVEKMI
jgi:hypothetical protein